MSIAAATPRPSDSAIRARERELAHFDRPDGNAGATPACLMVTLRQAGRSASNVPPIVEASRDLSLPRSASAVLSTDKLKLVCLSCFEGRPPWESAQGLGLPLGAMKYRLC
jgi:hypothetical protein